MMTDRMADAGEVLAKRLSRPIVASHERGAVRADRVLVSADLQPGAFEVDVAATAGGSEDLVAFDKLFEEEAYPAWVETAADRRAIVERAAERLREILSIPVFVEFL